MDQWKDLNMASLMKKAESASSRNVVDPDRTNRFSKICNGLCRSDPLTEMGPGNQLLKILCLTVLPILGVWGFTMHFLLINVDTKSDIETAKTSMAIVVKLGQLIHRLQRERDMSLLYLSEIGPGTKHFLLAEYMATDDALHSLTVWPKGLQSNPNPEFRSKANLMSFMSQHRISINPQKVDLFEEINFYSRITSEFLEWLIENIKGSGFGSIWKTLVAYQKITRCKEDIGVERAYGVMFFVSGYFEKWVDYEFYNEKINDFKYNYKTAVLYSDRLVPLHTDEVNEIKSTGLNITAIIKAYRYEIQYRELNQTYQSVEKAKWFFDNITIYLDSLLTIQEKVAARISEEVDEVLAEVITKVAVYALMVVVVIAMCPMIIFTANGLSSDIQICTLAVLEHNGALSIEKLKTETLYNHHVPDFISAKIRSNVQIESEYFKSVTVLLSEIYGFNRLSGSISPADLVELLNVMHTSLDDRIDRADLYKVETFQDNCLVASGVPTRNGEAHAQEIASLALEFLHVTRNITLPVVNQALQLRMGISTGPCTAGIVGVVWPRYCLFGDTITTANVLMSHSSPNHVVISESTHQMLSKGLSFHMKYCGSVDVKGRKTKTFWILNRVGGGGNGGWELEDDSDNDIDRFVSVNNPEDSNVATKATVIKKRGDNFRKK